MLERLWAAYPAVVTFVVIVTANHYWLDAALGAIVAAVVRLRGECRLRPRPAGGLGLADRRGMSDDLREGSRRARPARNGRGGPMTAAEIRAVARDRLIESRLTPNAISLAGLIGTWWPPSLILEEHFVLAGIAFVLGSLMDMFDGRYSRMSGKGTPFGAFLDSTLDRIEEGVVLAAVAAWFAKSGDDLAVGATVLTVVGSYMVSYTRARAEALGVECKVGIASRAVRVVILSAGLIFANEELIPGVRPARARHLRDGGAHDLHDVPARLPRAQAARAGGGVTAGTRRVFYIRPPPRGRLLAFRRAL